MDTLKPGDVVLVTLRGAVETKRRPAVVLSSVEYHQEHPDVVVGVLTTNIGAAVTAADHVLIDWLDAGLDRPTAYRSFLFTTPRSQVIRRLGALTPRDWQAVRARVRRALVVD